MRPPAPRRPERGSSPASRPARGHSHTQDSAKGNEVTHTARGESSSPARREKADGRRSSASASSARKLTRPVGQSDAAQILGPAQQPRSDAQVTDLRKERRRAKIRLRLTHVLTILGIAISVVGAAWVVFFSSVFAFEPANVSVSGVDKDSALSSDQVVAAVGRYSGVPLTRLSLDDVEAAVEENILVDTAQASRAWPTGLDIVVSLRQAVMVEASDQGVALVDAKGVAFSTQEVAPEGLPTVVLPAKGDRAEAAQDALTIWQTLDADTRSRVASIDASGAIVSLNLTNGSLAKWGTVEHSELKAKVLKVLIEQRGALVYDVSSPDHPVTS
ncbi:cell division protein FtsQ/DivIB [Schaalia vaccimaxillae]|uniref:cell division protein FtsQ/DivIB n=1 Tax=Schaalia vaccimaxillae TaxID=183916 RepID=UPI0003B690E0|nr:FtsQ-type POTRA domain-containing protein [Schaalia vaccimaxillae]